MKILLFAMDGLFSRIILENINLLKNEIKGIVLPEQGDVKSSEVKNNPFKIYNPNSIQSVADSLNIPVYTISNKNPKEYGHLLAATNPEIIIVACFPYKIPKDVYEYPQKGSYNIHPSLLPLYRGPTPLFWQFYFGEKNTGITIHALDDNYDTGDIIVQLPVSFNEGITISEATAELGLVSSYLVATLLTNLNVGNVNKEHQNNLKDSYFTWPDVSDFTINIDWEVKRAYNFICATRDSKHPYTVILNNKQKLIIQNAVGYEKNCHLGKDYAKQNGETFIQFIDGCLICVT